MSLISVLLLLPVQAGSGSTVSNITMSQMFDLAFVTISILFVLLVVEYLIKILSKASSIVK